MAVSVPDTYIRLVYYLYLEDLPVQSRNIKESMKVIFLPKI